MLACLLQPEGQADPVARRQQREGGRRGRSRESRSSGGRGPEQRSADPWRAEAMKGKGQGGWLTYPLPIPKKKLSRTTQGARLV